MAQRVQCYFLNATRDAPNSPLPIIHYQGVLPGPLTEENTVRFLTANKWEHRGTWGHIAIRHFHPNSHECYGIFRGDSKMLLGQISDGKGLEVDLRAGDVLVLPAGTAHSSLLSLAGYQYIGVYPQGCPPWRNEMGKNPPGDFKHIIQEVDMPEADPVYGKGGPLMQLWHKETLAKL